MYESPSKGKELTIEEIEAFNIWQYKQHGIMPNQWHHFYDEGSTIIYNEHIQDILVIDRIFQNKMKKHHEQQQAKANAKTNNPLAKQKTALGGFYGQKMRFDKNGNVIR